MSSSSIFPTSIIKVVAAFTLLIATGCHSKTDPTPENFTVALNAYFLTHSECLLENVHFPYETTDPVKTKQMDSLVTMQLLTVLKDRDIHASRYTLTTVGTRYAPKFCYGHRDITSIDSFTPPAPADHFLETQVSYHYAMKDIPVWARTPEVEAAFPIMAEAISGNASGKATLAKTLSGWQVPE